MFKPSHGCRSPHLNVDVLRAEMHRAELLTRHKLSTSDALLNWVESANRELSRRSEKEWAAAGARAKSGAALSKAMGKAHEQDFYLGMSWDWLK